MTKVIAKAIGILALSTGLASGAFAFTPSAHIGVQLTPHIAAAGVTSAPEIDPASAISGMTLLLGGLAMVRGRRAKK